jgi:hypothetical protein
LFRVDVRLYLSVLRRMFYGLRICTS